MANFLWLRDPDTARRDLAATQAKERVAIAPRLRAASAVTPEYALIWAAAAGAPVTHHQPGKGLGAEVALFGEPHDDAGEMVEAADLAAQFDRAWDAVTALNGYYAALAFHPLKGLRVEADVVGVFPIYYWQSGGVLLVASSPELFRCHPAFTRALDLHGVAALLLTSGIVAGRTLWQGVRRLGPDHRLVVPLQGPATEVAPPAPRYGEPITNLDEALEENAKLHLEFLRAALRGGSAPGLLLSGGLDSRLIAGFVATLGYRPQCLTFGEPRDLDASCATQVARALDLPQTLCGISPEDYPAFADASITGEHLAGGLYALPMGWNLSIPPPSTPVDRIVCGLTLDAVVGGPKHVASTERPLAFHDLRISRLGFGRDALDALVDSTELKRACEDVREHLVKEYVASEPFDHLREWRMNLRYRQRFAVGACAWRYALFAWPVMPALDRRLMQLAARLPATSVKGRHLQAKLLVTRYPALARLDLDRNFLDTSPLIRPRHTWYGTTRHRLVKLGRRCRRWLGHDPRFYVRTMDINGAGWRNIRILADQARPAGAAFFRRDALDQLVPPASVTVRHMEDAIAPSTPLKNTLGLLLWLRQHA